MGFQASHVFIEPLACDLPVEIAFLVDFCVDHVLLRQARDTAQRENVCAARALIVAGSISASFYYKALAHHLDLDFVDDWPQTDLCVMSKMAYRASCIQLAKSQPTRWLVAPEAAILHSLFRARRLGLPDLAIATPGHLAALVHYRGQGEIERGASLALPAQSPHFSAKGTVDLAFGVLVGLTILAALLALICAPRLIGDLLGPLFLASMVFRLGVAAASSIAPKARDCHDLADGDLPTYTILVPLRDEAEMVQNLLAALEAIDYPRSKLEVLVLVEPEDLSTRDALASARLPPWLHVILGPSGGSLRTKPRALNIGLMMARGTLLTVYDAEDRPAPDQLRRAAAAFAEAPGSLACLQAQLAISNGDASPLSKLFAIEYAALFDVLNIGTGNLGLPLALGGTSNHFRVSILREAGAWDAWNVTEDADLGLRLARLGYDVGCLASTTMETAPEKVWDWTKQRRRWTKGWMQTFLVLARDAPRVVQQLGWVKAGALALILTNLVIGPLLYPIFFGVVGSDLYRFGMPMRREASGYEAMLAAMVLVLGLVATLWCGYAGLKARQLWRFLPSLPLLVPYQLMISFAAWWGCLDLMLSPHHWHKTVHRPTPRAADTGQPSVVHRAQRRSGRKRRAGDRGETEGTKDKEGRREWDRIAEAGGRG